jgi:hypothetical protein
MTSAHRGLSFRKSVNHVTRTIANETIVVPIRAEVADLDSIFVLNEVGAAIWALLDAETGVEEIAAAVSRQFEVEPPAAREDIARFLAALQESGLVARVPGP